MYICLFIMCEKLDGVPLFCFISRKNLYRNVVIASVGVRLFPESNIDKRNVI